MKPKAKKTVSKKKATPAKKRSVAPKSAMTGYVVIWRHTMDDVPLSLFSDRAEAIKVASTMTRRSAQAAAYKLGFEVSTPLGFTVVHFEKGKAVNFLSVERDDDYC
jgi:hypothetical protein